MTHDIYYWLLLHSCLPCPTPKVWSLGSALTLPQSRTLTRSGSWARGTPRGRHRRPFSHLTREDHSELIPQRCVHPLVPVLFDSLFECQKNVIFKFFLHPMNHTETLYRMEMVLMVVYQICLLLSPNLCLCHTQISPNRFIRLKICRKL